MKIRMSGWLACAALLWLSAGGPARANSVEYYRYNIDTCGPEFAFAQPISPGVPGTYYAVEKDAQGRVVTITTKRNGKTLARSVLHYTAGQQYYTSTEDYAGTVLIGHSEMKYNSGGLIIRVDNFDKAGTRTGYMTVDLVPHGGTENVYTAEGKLRTVARYRCSTAGHLASLIRWSNPDDRDEYTVFDYNEETGLSTLRQQYRKGQVDLVLVSIYDGNGDRTNTIGSKPDGTVIVTEEYSDTLRTLRRYEDASSNAGLELHDHYNEKQWLDEVGVYFRGTFVCRLKYQMTSDGVVQKTIALGPNGELWAEYPDQLVYDINRDGTPVEGFPAVLHKTGDWW